MKSQVLIVETVYNIPKNIVWKALTDNNELKHWYFQLEDFIPKKGFKFEFTGGTEDGEKYLHLCEITEVIEEQKLAYSWEYEGYPGFTILSWELFDENGKTRLKLTHTGLESFAPNGKNFTVESFTGGWNYFLNEALKNYLASK